MCAKCGKSNCSDCTKINARTAKSSPCDPTWTGSVFYDGDNFTCAYDDTLTMTKEESLNVILNRFAAKFCAASVPVIYSSVDTEMNFPVSLARPEVWGSLTGLSATILEDGDYEIHAVLNYRHGQSGDPLAVIEHCSGAITLILNDVIITQDGLDKQLESQLKTGSTADFALAASLMHCGTFSKDDVIKLGIVTGVSGQYYATIGGQIIVRKIIDFVAQP